MKHSPLRLRWILLAGCLIVAAGAAWLALRVPFSSDTLRARLVSTLEDRLDSDVELGALALTVFPRFHVRGDQLVIRHRGRTDVPPLFKVAAFTVDADLAGLWRRHVNRVTLEGLEIHIPPRTGGDKPEEPDVTAGPHVTTGRQVVVDVLEAPGSRLVMLPRDKDKAPKVWNLHELRLETVSGNTGMPFRAVLTNAVPPGFIFTEGSFGPWHIDDPGHSPLDGRFTFDDADLGVFKGIAGKLSAVGKFGGTLERIDIHGTTNTPDFMVRISGHEVPLKTTYHAVVDGTNGDTTLQTVDAAFLGTTLTAKGGVYDVKGVKGRLVTLDITSTNGRLEDFMTLAIPTPSPPMTGALTLNTKFELPPGDRDIVEKLRLNGRFVIDQGRFTDPDIQQRINGLSQRATGKPEGPQPRVTSSFAGDFALADAELALRRLTFDVPGAVVDINGRYSLRRETLAFAGDLVMDAKISETFTGFRSFLLKAVDPLFRRAGRTVIPLRITGTRDKPSFGMDVKRVFTRRPAKP